MNFDCLILDPARLDVARDCAQRCEPGMEEAATRLKDEADQALRQGPFTIVDKN